jgi:selenocysteine lyase/cysteine desulfurase
MPHWHAIRAEFPALAHWTYLNTATFGQLARRTTDAVARHFKHRDEFACADFLDWYSDHDRTREAVARFLHCSSDDIAFFQNASIVLSLVMGGIDWRPGDRVVTLHNEFPNHLYWPAVLAERGAEFLEVDWPQFYDAISPNTRAVLLSTVNYTTGFRPPIQEIAQVLRERGVLFYLDATQSAGALITDVSEIQPDVLAVDAYKWMLAPNGVGFAYFSPRLREILEPNVIGWRSDHRWREVDNLHHGAPVFKSSAEKYEGAMLQSSLIYALGASIEMMMEIGPAAIEQRVLALAGLARDRLRSLGARLLYDEAPHFDSPVIAAQFPDRDVSALAVELRRHRIQVAARHGNLRVSTHFYNNEEDLDQLERCLRSLQ